MSMAAFKVLDESKARLRHIVSAGGTPGQQASLMAAKITGKPSDGTNNAMTEIISHLAIAVNTEDQGHYEMAIASIALLAARSKSETQT